MEDMHTFDSVKPQKIKEYEDKHCSIAFED